MAVAARNLKGKVIISGYDSDLYRDLFPDFKKVKRVALADGASKRVECLWMNYEPPVLIY